jgi:hypothetical protein
MNIASSRKVSRLSEKKQSKKVLDSITTNSKIWLDDDSPSFEKTDIYIENR